ncbi:hypothetical protein [Serratia rubidaea]|uniref:hypothetical protein n=1 Tax=Serratia rubidaea TaxID=61652 RepID=UPI002349CF1B|nr:hypothetical protein [Serratia rubidaea]MDC6109408.1 hypothetical protein [Serratia rubidaea]
MNNDVSHKSPVKKKNFSQFRCDVFLITGLGVARSQDADEGSDWLLSAGKGLPLSGPVMTN